jgi:CRISPR/Cas system-associated exonuclease Cas4 (RecB family)
VTPAARVDGGAATVAGTRLAETACVAVETDSLATISLARVVETNPVVVVGGSVVVVVVVEVEVEVDVAGVGLVDVVEEDVVDDELVVVEAGIVDGTASPPLAAVTSAINPPTT